MKLAVNPSRMELLRLKKRLGLARRGHKLLKDKQDELMKKFLALVERERKLRPEVEEKLARVQEYLLMARGVMRAEVLESSLSFPSKRRKLEVTTERILNVKVPHYRLSEVPFEFSYGFLDTSGDLDIAISLFNEVYPLLIELAEVEKSLYLLGEELKKTRRRVNALEYILIPNFEETIKYITLKLEELERSTLTRLMRVKEMVQSR